MTTAELLELERLALQVVGNGVEEWTKALMQRFKESIVVAL